MELGRYFKEVSRNLVVLIRNLWSWLSFFTQSRFTLVEVTSGHITPESKCYKYFTVWNFKEYYSACRVLVQYKADKGTKIILCILLTINEKNWTPHRHLPKDRLKTMAVSSLVSPLTCQQIQTGQFVAANVFEFCLNC